MPIVVRCPTCHARLSAPDSTAGKRARCRRCRGVVPVPAAVRATAPVPEPPPAPTPRPPAVPPRRAAVVVGLLMLATVGFGAYYLITTDAPPAGSGRENEPLPKEVAARTAVPPGWVEFAPPGGGFRAYLPARPREQR